MTTEERAVQALTDQRAYLWHSGGGVMCARVDLPDEVGYLLITDGQDYDEKPGYALGIYQDYEDEGSVEVYPDDESLRETVKQIIHDEREAVR